MTKGKYIVLEGPEGVGKTTQLLELERRVRAAGLPVRSLREPDSLSDVSARTIRRLTQDPRYPLNTASEVLLYNAARAQSLQIIKKSVEQGVICLVDRNYLTTLAIQYYGRGDITDYETINRIISFAVNGVEPDLCIILDAPVNTLVERLSKRYQGERFDRIDPAFLERVRAGYLWEAKQRSLPVVYGSSAPDETAEAIWKLASEVLAIREPSKASGQPTPLKDILEAKRLPIPHEPPLDVAANEGAGPPATTTGLAPLAPSIEPVATAARNYKVSFLASDRFGRAIRQSGAELLYQTLPDTAINFPFYIPPSLPETLRGDYTATIIEILSLHTRLSQKLTAHAGKQTIAANVKQQVHNTLRAVLPLAVQQIATINATATQASAVTAVLSQITLPEIQGVTGQGHPIQAQASSSFHDLADELLPSSIAADAEAVTLTDYWPRNEFDLLATMLYDFSDKSLEQLGREISGWPYDQKARLFERYFAQPVEHPAFSKARYSWDIMSDFGTYLTCVQSTAAVALRQTATPRFGYETPELIDAAALNDEYERCFDLSLSLHSKLQAAGQPVEAECTTLIGHRLRWTITLTGDELLTVHSTLANSTLPSHTHLARLLYEHCKEVHPRLADLFLAEQTTATQSIS